MHTGRNIGIMLLAMLVAILLMGCVVDTAPDAEAIPSPSPTSMPEPTPVPLDGPLPLGLLSELTDEDHNTWVGGEIVLHHEERKIGSIYLEWDKIPETWTLTADGVSVTVEKDGFLHQYVRLDAPASEVILYTEAPLCEVYAFEPAAEIPDWVQIWEPTWDKADLLLLPTHADDEHVFFGGMMPYYAVEKGYRVQVAYLTNHWSRADRPHELLDGLWTVGIRNYPVISQFPDRWADSLEQALERFDKEAMVAFQVEQLRRFRPSVVIGHDLNGEYGHGVHILNAVTLTEAVEYAADATLYPESAQTYGVWDTPKLYLHLYPEQEIIMDWDVPLTAFDGKTAMEMARLGFACHASQQGYFYVYGAGDAHDSRRFGLFRSLVGPDVVGGDVFENITSFY